MHSVSHTLRRGPRDNLTSNAMRSVLTGVVRRQRYTPYVVLPDNTAGDGGVSNDTAQVLPNTTALTLLNSIVYALHSNNVQA